MKNKLLILIAALLLALPALGLASDTPTTLAQAPAATTEQAAPETATEATALDAKTQATIKPARAQQRLQLHQNLAAREQAWLAAFDKNNDGLCDLCQEALKAEQTTATQEGQENDATATETQGEQPTTQTLPQAGAGFGRGMGRGRNHQGRMGQMPGRGQGPTFGVTPSQADQSPDTALDAEGNPVEETELTVCPHLMMPFFEGPGRNRR